MTICISAIGTKKEGVNEEEFIVFATDHMITTGNNEFEHEIKKYKELNGSAVAMLSGQTLLFEELLKETSSLTGYDNIKEKIYQNFKERKKFEVKSKLLDPLGISEQDLKQFLITPLNNPFTKNILENILGHSLQTSILLVGFRDGEAQIYEINEGECISVRDIHFHTIGSGSIQASNALLFQRHCKENDLKKTIYNVYKAKKNAEVAQGVGNETEILVCYKNKIMSVSKEDIEKLDKIYKEELAFGLNKCCQEDLNSLEDINRQEVMR